MVDGKITRPPRSRFLKSVLQALVFVAAGYFIAASLWKNWTKLGEFSFRPNVLLVLLSLVAMGASFAWLNYLWHRGAHALGVRTPFAQMWFMYMKSSILRYIPGNVVGLAARVYMMTKVGMAKADAVLLLALESALLVISSIAIYFATLVFHAGSAVFNVGLGVLGVLLCIMVASPRAFMKLTRIVYGELPFQRLPYSFIGWLGLGYSVYWVLNGVGILCLFHAFVPDVPISLVQCIGVFAVSWALGFLSIVSPSGIGVREAVLIFFFSRMTDGSSAILIAVSSRVVFIIGELLGFAIAAMAQRKRVPEMQNPAHQ